MAEIRIQGNAVAAHDLMHRLGIHHHAPALIGAGDMVMYPDLDAVRFKTNVDPGWLAAKLREHLPGLGVEVKAGLWWRQI